MEGAASYLLENKKIDAIFIGADRIVSNGDTANKIGSSSLAIIASHYNVPFYVVAPTSSFDTSLESGENIEIEFREKEEITSIKGVPIAPLGANVINPSFDVTRSKFIEALFCERGKVKPVNEKEVRGLF